VTDEVTENLFSIRIKLGDNEVELNGSFTEILQVLSELPTIIERVSDVLKITSTQSKLKKEPTLKPFEEKLPVIRASSNSTCPEAITQILSTNWGRKQPRYFREILDAMKTNALHYPTGTVKGRLTDLTKKGVLRRIRSEKGYGYVLAR
jgi:hypothetical protein